MKRAAWASALIIAILGLGAVLLAPDRLPGGRAGNPWETGGTPPAATAARPAPVVRPELHVIEQLSPIVGRDGALAETLGIEDAGGVFVPILTKGEPTPAMRVRLFQTATAGQREIRLHVLRGSSDRTAEDHSLGWFSIGDLPPGPDGLSRIGVLFRVADDTVLLAAFDPATGRSLPFGPSEPPH